MERDLFRNPRFGDNLVEAFIAPPVARKVEYPSGARCGHVFQQDIVGHGKQPYIDLRPRFAAGRVDPQLFVYFLNILRHQASDVDIGQSGEATKQKRVPDTLYGEVFALVLHHTGYLFPGQVVACDEFAL